METLLDGLDQGGDERRSILPWVVIGVFLVAALGAALAWALR